MSVCARFTLAKQRSDVPKTQATHVRLVVLSTQCTGFAGYAGEQDNDPRANSDCATAGPAAASQTEPVPRHAGTG